LSVKSPKEYTVTLEVAVELAAKLRRAMADIVNSHGEDFANLNVPVALCLIVSEVPMIVTL
jgi:N-acetylmuramoyl-L-alanine amidase